jgi:Na+/melibiose symporter-like transporter
MAPDQSRDDAASIWRKQQTEDFAVTLANIHEAAQKLQSQIRRRNTREYAAAVAAILVFGLYLWICPGWMMKTGSALSIVATLFVVWQLHKRGAAQEPAAHYGKPLVEAHRAELMRQRDLLKSVGVWYLAPFVPGTMLMMLGRYFQVHMPGRTLAWDHQIILMAAIVVALVFGIVWLLNVWGAERLQRRIDELDHLRSRPPRDGDE